MTKASPSHCVDAKKSAAVTEVSGTRSVVVVRYCDLRCLIAPARMRFFGTASTPDRTGYQLKEPIHGFELQP